MGQPLGTRATRLAHRVLGHEPEVPGEGFDIHGGGRDLIFPHHENEIAQAEGAMAGGEASSGAATGGATAASPAAPAAEPFVRFWMHNGMLNLRSEKMSKSLGNILTLRHILDEHRPEALITAFLGSHYRSPLEFSSELLEETEQQVDRLRNVFRELADRAAVTECAPGEAGDSDRAHGRQRPSRRPQRGQRGAQRRPERGAPTP